MERVDANLIPFAKNNPSGYRFAFGTDTATDDINANYNDNIKKGWGTTPNEFPEVEDFNAMAYTSSYLTAYLYQMGIAEWNNKQNYRINSRVIGSDGNLYKSLTGTIGSPNAGNNPLSDVVNWKSLEAVFLTGNQTVNGVKTFSSNIVGNITGNAGTATIAADSNKLVGKNWYWSGQSGQPVWLWGGSDGTNMYVYNPSNFNVNYANTAEVANNAIGYGQTWQNVTSSRVSGTTYTNSTGKPIQVSISSGIANGGATITFTVNGITITRNFNGASAGYAGGFDIIIPNGSTYSATLTPIVKWLELR